MFNKGIEDTLLKDKIKRELNNLSYRIELDEMEKVINKDTEYIKEYEEEMEETEEIINNEDNLAERFKKVKYIGKYKHVLFALFKRILRDNKEYIEARKRTNKYFRNLIKILREDL